MEEVSKLPCIFGPRCLAGHMHITLFCLAEYMGSKTRPRTLLVWCEVHRPFSNLTIKGRYDLNGPDRFCSLAAVLAGCTAKPIGRGSEPYIQALSMFRLAAHVHKKALPITLDNNFPCL